MKEFNMNGQNALLRVSLHCIPFVISLLSLTICVTVAAGETFRKPIMGWSSWNHFAHSITEDIVKAQADAIKKYGLDKYGYVYVNIDDCFFGGRDESGKIFAHPDTFPGGMGALASYMHARGLKAGIYTDAGPCPCSSYNREAKYSQIARKYAPTSVGCGLYGFEREDLTRYLIEWNYDFIKVDWCGGNRNNLNDQARYTEISKIIREIKPETVFNVCRWRFPGKWVIPIADSWRIGPDHHADFKSMLKQVDRSANHQQHSRPGHYNDMDMMQVGRGMSYEEDKAHFTMWCVMQSPLLMGNDLTKISKETLEIITNEDLIAINQGDFSYQAKRLESTHELELWARPLISKTSGEVAVVLLNRSSESADMSFALSKVGIDASQGYFAKDLWSKQEYPKNDARSLTFKVPSHAVVVLKIKGESYQNTIF